MKTLIQRRHTGGVTFAWVEERRAEWPVARMCRVSGVSRAGFSAWRSREPSASETRREGLTEQVTRIHAQVKARYGSPRMHAELVGRGHACRVNTVARVMREAGIAAKTRRRFRQTTDSDHPHPVADNVLDRQFDPAGPNASWVADVTYVPTREGWLYLAVVVDLFRRLVVGWSMAAAMTSRLVVDALGMALGRRPGGSSGLVAHSDRGSQYASEHYRRRLQEERIVCSMSRRGNCWDNAPMESFFASLKKELVHDPRRGAGEHLRVRRGVRQPRPLALVAGVRLPGRVRADAQPEPPLTSTPFSLGNSSDPPFASAWTTFGGVKRSKPPRPRSLNRSSDRLPALAEREELSALTPPARRSDMLNACRRPSPTAPSSTASPASPPRC